MIGMVAMNNDSLEKSIIAGLLNDFNRAQTIYLKSEWFTNESYRALFKS